MTKQNFSPLVNEILRDDNANGMPDIVENALVNKSGVNNVATTFVIRGKQYNSVAEMSSEDKAYFEQKMSQAKWSAQPATTISSNVAQTVPEQTRGVRPVTKLTELNNPLSNDWKRAVVAIAVLVSCAAISIGLWKFFIK